MPKQNEITAKADNPTRSPPQSFPRLQSWRRVIVLGVLFFLSLNTVSLGPAVSTPYDIDFTVFDSATPPSNMPHNDGAVVRFRPPVDPARLTLLSAESNCPKGYILTLDQIENASNFKIPKVVHQTSKSRCLSKDVAKVTDQWKFKGWSYYFWDDEAIMRLFRSHYDEFPNLQAIVENCMPTGTVKADLWRYLVLYTYGGVYADIDSAPNSFNKKTLIKPDDEAWFAIEYYGLLSQYFMASAPRHPLMYYTIQLILSNMHNVADTGKISAPGVTGPHALHRGFRQFLLEVGYKGPEVVRSSYQSKQENPVVHNGTFVGHGNWTVTVLGDARASNDIVIREALPQRAKAKLYHDMGMKHFSEEREGPGTNMSCLNAFLPNSDTSN